MMPQRKLHASYSLAFFTKHHTPITMEKKNKYSKPLAATRGITGLLIAAMCLAAGVTSYAGIRPYTGYLLGGIVILFLLVKLLHSARRKIVRHSVAKWASLLIVLALSSSCSINRMLRKQEPVLPRIIMHEPGHHRQAPAAEPCHKEEARSRRCRSHPS